MRMSLLAASALALLAVPALAQTTPGGAPPRSSSGPGATPPAATVAPKPDPLKQEDVAQIKGSAVYGSNDTKIGSVSTVLMKPDNKTIDRLVVGAGGVLGVGAHNVALPVDQFQWDASKGGFKLAKTEDDLKKMPEWQAAGTSGAASSGSSTPPASGSSTTAPSSTR